MPNAPLYDLEEYIMNDAIQYINTVVNVVKPTDLVYIAIDGVCPMAKMVQQRKRRYISAWRREKLEPYMTGNKLWDSNIITPGTQFMTVFNEKIKAHVSRMNAHIVSDSTEFGEGEHKIMNYIRENPCEGLDVIYGLDADLIMLSMLRSTSNKNIMLLRETPEFMQVVSTPFLILDINELKASLCKEYAGVHSQIFSDSDNYRESFIKDYVVVCSLLGNDFVPPLSFLKIKNNAIDYLLDCYNKTLELLREPLVTKTNELNHMFLGHMLGVMANQEDHHMNEAIQAYKTRRVFANKRGPAFELDNYPVLYKFDKEIDASKPGWRIQYYEHLFYDHNPEFIAHVCRNYLEGFSWILRYYLQYDAPVEWHYRYSYSPTILDLSNHIGDLGDSIVHDMRIEFSDEEFRNMMGNGELQLLSVLPPQSSHLLSKDLQSIMNDVDKGCVHMYPTKFRISTFLKYYLWECSASLPDIEIANLYRAYKSIR
jgi:5'-3' exonuclease